jgi:hypothetical protein
LRIARDTYFRVSLARGIKEPALIENFARESFFVGNPNLRPEKTNSYEPDYRTSGLARRIETGITCVSKFFPGSDRLRLHEFPGDVEQHRPQLGARHRAA